MLGVGFLPRISGVAHAGEIVIGRQAMGADEIQSVESQSHERRGRRRKHHHHQIRRWGVLGAHESRARGGGCGDQLGLGSEQGRPSKASLSGSGGSKWLKTPALDWG